MEANIFVIISLVIIAAIWVAIQFASANDSINRAIAMVQMPDDWHVYKEKGEATSIPSSVADSLLQNPQPQKQSEGSFQKEIIHA